MGALGASDTYGCTFSGTQLTVLEGVTEEVYLAVQGCHRSLWGIQRGGQERVGFCRTYAKYLVLPN